MRKHVKHRPTARIMLVNEGKEVLLYKTHFDPEVQLPPRWLTPGGGIDEGETAQEAAVRELFEETGMRVDEKDLGEPILVASGTWLWGDGVHSHTYTDTIYRFDVETFSPDTSGFTQDELRDVLEIKWWNVQELLDSEEQLAPQELAAWLRANLL
jgi:8-oxo-dGTP pyrophosphatase MutT (NUDIX family)